ncbi:MAG: class I mannose-6-phosphate isomerase [Clostridia bacterium]|nr:class I mannose-6-phosphate isomerase [Clostridia bacterium]
MLYPIKFHPVYKDYIWGGRNLENLGKKLPEGIVAESWEISCHPDGMSHAANGIYEGQTLQELMDKLGPQLLGKELYHGSTTKFPLLVKLIDANDRLSVQVHPDDIYANAHENGELGKTEMWYIISAQPGAKLIYDVHPGITRKDFEIAIQNNTIENCLKSIEVFPGDVINIPAGLVHAIGKGIVLAEIQQNSNTTYRVYDYDRTDSKGNKRPLHIQKALDVIDFNSGSRTEKAKGLAIKLGTGSSKIISIANAYFCVELYDINGTVEETATGEKFFIYVFTGGSGIIRYKDGEVSVSAGESILIPASMSSYSISGNLKALKAYVPDIERDVFTQLMAAGYWREIINSSISGLC